MKKESEIRERVSVLATDKRFELIRSEVEKELLDIKDKGLIDAILFERIQNEDILLKIKYRSYKKCLRQIVIGFVLVGVGFIVLNTSSVRYLCIAGGILLMISSFFGVLSNRK